LAQWCAPASPLDLPFQGSPPCFTTTVENCLSTRFQLLVGQQILINATSLFSLPLQPQLPFSQCFPIIDPLSMLKKQNCDACLNFTTVSYSASGLHMCFQTQTRCQGNPPFQFLLTTPGPPTCVDTQECQFLSCAVTRCSGNGNCNSFGGCQCNLGFFGQDCSFQHTIGSDECSVDTKTGSKTCWTTSINTSTCEASFKEGNTTKLIKLKGTLKKVKFGCSNATFSFGGSPCIYCPSYNNLTYNTQGELNGCTIVTGSCGGTQFMAQAVRCGTISKAEFCNSSAVCGQNCLRCSRVAPNPCSQCGAGYYVSGGLCSMCEGGLNYTCKQGEYRLGAKCSGTGTSPTQQCSVCQNGGAQQAYSCPSGFYPNGTKCNGKQAKDSQSCIECTPVTNCEGLITCSTGFNSQCSTCKSGFYLYDLNSPLPDTCLPDPPMSIKGSLVYFVSGIGVSLFLFGLVALGAYAAKAKGWFANRGDLVATTDPSDVELEMRED